MSTLLAWIGGLVVAVVVLLAVGVGMVLLGYALEAILERLDL